MDPFGRCRNIVGVSNLLGKGGLFAVASWEGTTFRTGRILLFLFGCVVVAGIVGFRYLADLSWVDALFYTFTTLTTVGFEAPPNLSEEGKLFTVLLLVVGIGIAGYAVAFFSQNVVVSGLLTALGKRRDKRVEAMREHWIICGLGRVGRNVAEIVFREEAPFVGIDRNEALAEAARRQGWMVLVGDAREEEILEAAGITRAAGLIVALDSDADNVYVLLTARSLNKNLRIIARAQDTQSVNVLYRAGADKVLNPLLAGAAAMARAALKPAVADFLEMASISKQLQLEFDAVRLAADNPLVGTSLQESPLKSRYNLLVVAVKAHGGEVLYNPPGTTVLASGDELVLLGEREKIASFRKELCTPVLAKEAPPLPMSRK